MAVPLTDAYWAYASPNIVYVRQIRRGSTYYSEVFWPSEPEYQNLLTNEKAETRRMSPH